MEIRTINCGLLGTNCYILTEGTDAVVFDPDGEKEKIYSLLKGYDLRAVILTHGHFDHIGAVDDICRETGTDLYINVLDAEMLEDPHKNASFLLPESNIICTTPPKFFDGDNDMYFGDIHLKVLHTPGHTKGSSCFICGDILISGDTLFRSGIGRTDLYGGDTMEEYNSIRKLFALDRDYTVYPGHGLKTTLKKEKRGLI
ncbi:MAG: MBL fold metallo-hydrolase [Clostridia bacterium]|nr:MBL fold metallo-hydrolase [Clostridia bacterium]